MIKEFFDQNPISQLALVSTSNMRATKLTDFTGNARKHSAAVKQHVAGAPFKSGGDASLQNALVLANQMLESIPQYGVREILILWGALTTVDPNDIFATVSQLQTAKVRCSVISMAAEMYICKHLCASTNGESSVATDMRHLKELLMANSAPAASLTSTSGPADNPAYLIQMGFPRASLSRSHKAFCACHQEVKSGGYTCPRCSAKMCDLPSQCQVCGLSLMSSSHLARSYHHLFPVGTFIEQPQDLNPESRMESTGTCHGCQAETETAQLLTCPKCEQLYCYECDAFIHDSLHVCPGCEALDQG
eukprot:TRINITY_DN19986_c0_g1_i1.p1 TRINITY_DN19986_c0_g1~~TRINITY_DN19986_c0_g1_i1.p1  ORF type:complete len:305 (-),score=47.34 TRINITY_DN19986_c0_g1_i1:357-1271(-)